MITVAALAVAGLLLLTLFVYLRDLDRIELEAWSRSQLPTPRLDKEQVAVPTQVALWIDRSRSMAGFVDAEEGTFLETLNLLSQALGAPEVFSYGRSGELVRHAGLDSSLRNGASYDRGFNDDAVALAGFLEDSDHALIMVTDGVTSAPAGEGIEPVVHEWARLLDAGWGLGVLGIEGAFACPHEDCFYSEALRGRSAKLMMPLPCEVVTRPFYFLVLDRGRERFDRIRASLDGSPASLRLEFWVPPHGAEMYSTGPLVVDQRVAVSDGRWRLLERRPKDPLNATVSLSPAEESPLRTTSWGVTVAKKRRGASAADPWQAVGPDTVVLKQERRRSSIGLRPRFLSEADFRTDVQGLNGILGELAKELDDQGREANPWVNWAPPNSDEDWGDLFCALVDLDPLRANAAVRRKADLVWGLRAYKERQDPSLVREIRRLISDGKLRGIVDSWLGEEPLPLDTLEPPKENLDLGPKRISLQVRPALFATDRSDFLYRFRLQPAVPELRDTIYNLSTPDDGELADVGRTYRLANWIGALVQTRLDRQGEEPVAEFYLTVPKR